MSSQKQDHPSIKVCIAGVSGVGKSTLFEKLIKRENARFVFLYDHKNGDLARRFGKMPCYGPEELIAKTELGGYIIFDPARLFPGKPEKGFEFFCEYVWSMRELKGKKIFGSDELDGLVDAKREPESLCMILDQGRTFQIDCMFIAQAMNGIHNQARKQFTEVFAFRQGDENGVNWLAQKGFNPGSLMSLKNGLWHYKNILTGEQGEGGTAFEPKNATRNLRGL